MPKDARAYADSGYQGYQDDHPDLEIPYKKSKKKPLSKDERAYNHALSRFRVRVEHAIGIWNERVAALYQKYKTLRTVILLKGEGLNKVSVFEIPTVRYNPQEYEWSWNKRKNLVGLSSEGRSKFTWQPHGSQFTIHEEVPDYALNIEIDQPATVPTDKILETVKFSEKSYRVVPRVAAPAPDDEEED